MARPRARKYRDPGEHAGYRWRDTHLRCPRCGGACRTLETSQRGSARGIECKECDWSQFPGNAPPLGTTPAAEETKQHREARIQRQAEEPQEKNTTCQKASSTPNADGDSADASIPANAPEDAP